MLESQEQKYLINNHLNQLIMILTRVEIQTGIISTTRGTFIVIEKYTHNINGLRLTKKKIKIPLTSLNSLCTQLKEFFDQQEVSRQLSKILLKAKEINNDIDRLAKKDS